MVRPGYGDTVIGTDGMQTVAERWWLWLYQPGWFLAWSVLIFIPLRLILGPANYMCSRCWYYFAFIVPMLVASGLLPSIWSVPVSVDWPCAFHITFSIAYIQVDLCAARLLCGPGFGAWSIPELAINKLDPRPRNLDGLTPPGVPPLCRTLFEFNASLIHEIFWNICFCQNCINHGIPDTVAILAVPAASGLLHGICCNVNSGIRMLPNFLSVGLAYCASGSIIPPMLMHSMWYLLDGKMCFLLKHAKRDWDVAERREEVSTPPWDFTSSIGLVLVLIYYVPLNVLVNFLPQLKSQEGFRHAQHYRPGHLPTHPIEQVLIFLCLVQVIVGFSTFRQVRSSMDVLEETGDFTKEGIENMKEIASKYAVAQAP